MGGVARVDGAAGREGIGMGLGIAIEGGWGQASCAFKAELLATSLALLCRKEQC